MEAQDQTIDASIDQCLEEINNTINALQSLAGRISAVKSTFTSMDDREASFHQVTFYHIATALREPHLSMSYAKQEIRTLENVARNRAVAS